MTRKSFLIHIDSLDVLDELNDTQIAELFKAIRDYNLGKEPKLSGLMKAIFLPFKNQFIRDNEKYMKIVERNKRNGKKGGRPELTNNQQNKANPEKPKKPSGLSGNPEKPKKPDSDSDNDNDSENDNKYNSEIKNFTGELSKFFPANIVSKLTKAQKNNWVDAVDKLIRIDKFSREEIESVVRHFRADNFWKDNFQTIIKLRTKNKEGVSYMQYFLNKIETETEQAYMAQEEITYDKTSGF